ncbi:MAG: hypothetical protein ACERKO_00325 [Acetanaerobacterium sp.]
MNSFNKNSEVTVLFVGNSLTGSGRLPEHLSSIAQKQYRTIHLHQKINEGYHLAQHAQELSGERYAAIREQAEVVILQEYGGAFCAETLPLIAQIRALFRPDVQICSLITELDYPKELLALDNHRYLYGGYAHHLMVDGGILTYEQLHLEGDTQPNELYGYLVACVIFGTLFLADCENLDDEFLDPAVIPGESERQKRETMRRIKRAANMACEFSREHAMMLRIE